MLYEKFGVLGVAVGGGGSLRELCSLQWGRTDLSISLVSMTFTMDTDTTHLVAMVCSMSFDMI